MWNLLLIFLLLHDYKLSVSVRLYSSTHRSSSRQPSYYLHLSLRTLLAQLNQSQLWWWRIYGCTIIQFNDNNNNLHNHANLSGVVYYHHHHHLNHHPHSLLCSCFIVQRIFRLDSTPFEIQIQYCSCGFLLSFLFSAPFDSNHHHSTRISSSLQLKVCIIIITPLLSSSLSQQLLINCSSIHPSTESETDRGK